MFHLSAAISATARDGEYGIETAIIALMGEQPQKTAELVLRE